MSNNQQQNSPVGLGFFSSLSNYFQKNKFKRYDSVNQIINQGLTKLEKRKKKKTQTSFTLKRKKQTCKQTQEKVKEKEKEKEKVKKKEKEKDQKKEKDQNQKQNQTKEKVEKVETQTQVKEKKSLINKTKISLKVSQENFEQFDQFSFQKLQRTNKNEEMVLECPLDFIEYHSDLIEKVRESQGISLQEYHKSIKGIKPMVTDSGKSGAFFFRSKDKRYVVKSIPKTDSQVLKQILPDYLEHLIKNPNSLINPIYGHYKLKTENVVEYYIIMANVFQSDLPIDQIYDLKGSTIGRENSTENENSNETNLQSGNNGIQMEKVLKDNDLDEKIEMSFKTKKLFIKQLESDLDFLQKHKLMDYSLLLGIHHLNHEQNSKESIEKTINSIDENNQLNKTSRCNFNTEQRKNDKNKEKKKNDNNDVKINGNNNNNKKVNIKLNKISNKKKTCNKNGNQNGNKKNKNKNHNDNDNGNDNGNDHGGSDSIFKQYHGGLYGERPNCKNKKCIYYMGIIDMLQFFSFKKEVESGLKGLFYGDSMSSVDPETYARRFMLTMLNITNSKNDKIDFQLEYKKYSEPKVEENNTQETQNNTGFFASFFNRDQTDEQPSSNYMKK
ncbi:phosphatidylinositol 5-phosphate 4-kinase [Anaeramoeba flamelloides]|uniref:Phosphatidylinositol 5-phosphate 4-kinase n=1 Tax=Anaeramoeba flamelloides TaxID=1746091 RepID=A0ABQ8YEG1_9EUKA|nr:phosphatidylinositol 5-phosphate 4-kinase [Anaeramoeba flamelloides]